MKTKILSVLAGIFLLPSVVFAEVPNNVSGLAAYLAEGGIDLDWVDATNIDGTLVDHYRVYIDTHAVGDAEAYIESADTKTNVNTYKVTSFQGKPLELGTQYFFSVTAMNAGGEESYNYSNEASIKFDKYTAPTGENKENEILTAIAGEKKEIATLESKLELNEDVKVIDNETIVVIFNEVISLPENPEEAFLIEEDMEGGNILGIKSMKVLEDGFRVEIKTEKQRAGKDYKITALSSIEDEQGNPLISGLTDTAYFTGTAKTPTSEESKVTEVSEETHPAAEDIIVLKEPVADLTGPSVVSGFNAKYRYNPESDNYTVDLSWIPAKDPDLSFQKYSFKRAESPFTESIIVDKNKTSYQAVLEGGEKYTFKIVSVDVAGNESPEVLTSLFLPATGPALVILLAGVMAFATAWYVRRKVNVY